MNEFAAVQPFAVFAFSAILVSLCAVFIFLAYGVFANTQSNGLTLPQPVIMTASAVILIGVFLSSLFVGQEIIFADNAPVETTAAVVETADSETDLTALAARIDKAAEQLYSGLDTTKAVIGKTEVRNQAIEHGRNHANEKLIALAQRIRRALRGEAPLNAFDRNVAEHLTKGVK